MHFELLCTDCTDKTEATYLKEYPANQQHSPDRKHMRMR